MKNKSFDLTGKHAIVTGGGSGIGKAIAVALAGQGAEVSILDLNIENGQHVADTIVATGGKAVCIACFVSDFESVNGAFNAATEGKGLDILVNNAGIAHIGSVGNTSPDDFDTIYGVNVKGVFHCLKAGVERMKSSGGAIINISSIAAHVGLSDRFAYSMSKGAVHSMTLSVAKDYLSDKIRCNSIAPGRVHTPFVDGFLADNYPGKEDEMFEASFITGSCFYIDGGFITLNT